MRNAVTLLTVASALFLSASSIAQDRPVTRFDGKWTTTVSCVAIRDALGFSYRFVSEVKDGHFHGLHGVEGEPGYLLVDGKIDDDGASDLYAQGKTGSKEFVPGRDTPKGTEYGYHVKAHFRESKGEGTRVEGRPCSYEFEKKSDGH